MSTNKQNILGQETLDALNEDLSNAKQYKSVEALMKELFGKNKKKK